ncbi:MAG: hypothetical protein IJY39_09690 [Clostridia bacterium]|nr:hypothetical protein [Clostridia bacterium]
MTFYFNKKRTRGITIPVSRERAELFLRRVIICLVALACVLGAVCLVLALQFKWVNIEAGDGLTAAEIARDDSAVFGEDFDPDCVNHAGIYYFTVLTDERVIDVRLRVYDTESPRVTVKNVKSAVGGELPKPEDFIDSIYEPDDYTGEYVTALPEIEKMGNYSAQIRFTDASGNKTKIFDVEVTVTVDTEPPSIAVAKEVTVLVGDPLVLDVKLTDNCTGALSYTVDDSGVDLTEEGKYQAYVVATDAIGNVSEPVSVTVRVVAWEETETE